jgi:hypothetical protein
VHDVALVELQVSVDDVPEVVVDGLADSNTVGEEVGGVVAGVTLTVTD